MFRSTSNFDKLLDKATSNLLLEPDWPTTIQICDLIRQNDVQPKYAIGAIKKKLYSQNPHCAMFALQVLESIVKNCGATIHNEVASKETCEMFRELAKTSPHESVRQKVLELIQGWAFAFRKQPKYRAVSDIVNIMKAEGYKFPVLNESDAMFSADTAPEWSDGTCCHRCRVPFTLVVRKHHCRNCGQVFCSQCSQHSTTLPKFGIEKEVRVCEGCYDQLHKATSSATAALVTKTTEGDLPAEYVSSSLAQQSQQPPRKTEEELREEEELNLALALSQSEAEHKEKEKKRITRDAGRSYSPSPVGNRSPSPKADDVDPELARYLNRSYWEQKQGPSTPDAASPSAPTPAKSFATSSVSPSVSPSINNRQQQNLAMVSDDPEMNEFVAALKSQVEIFVNRMKSNSSRGRSIANDSSVQTLFMNITAMHSRLLRYIQQQDDDRLRFEGLQDKLSQVKDARAALDALREEHQEQLRREAEEAERQRQLQMAHKLDIMRKKKQEYLQYQRQLALQRIQEQEREMQMRQEQQKQQYLMGTAGMVAVGATAVPQYGGYMGSPVHMPPPTAAPGQYLPPQGAQMPPGAFPHAQPPTSASYPMYAAMAPPPGTPGMPMPGHLPMGGPPPTMRMPPQPHQVQPPQMQPPPQAPMQSAQQPQMQSVPQPQIQQPQLQPGQQQSQIQPSQSQTHIALQQPQTIQQIQQPPVQGIPSQHDIVNAAPAPPNNDLNSSSSAHSQTAELISFD